MRVALAEDAALFRNALASLLRDLNIDVTHVAHDEQSLLAGIVDEPPDVVILDIRMPPTWTTEGFHAAASVRRRHPGTGILLLSQYDEIAYVADMLEYVTSGVGYLNKDRVDDVSVLFDALRRVAAGEVVIDEILLQHSPQAALRELTEREREAMWHLAAGRSNKGIAHAMYISEGAVEKYLAMAFRKLGLTPDPQDNLRVLAILRWFASRTQ